MDSALQELLGDFLLEARERLDRVEESLLSLDEAPVADRGELIARARRDLHTLKGNSGMMGLSELQSLAHTIEDQVEALDPLAPDLAPPLAGLDRFRAQLRQVGAEGGAPEEVLVGDGREKEEASQELALGGVRVSFDQLDGLVELLAEVLLYRNRLGAALADVRTRNPARDREAADSWSQLAHAHESLDKTLEQLQERIIQLRMVPLQSLFRHLSRIVHDESVREGKHVQLETGGGSTPLDKALLELASEALGHLVRNAVNHGIESAAERLAAGKPEIGRIELNALVHGQEVHIEVADDGAGVDPEKLRRAAERLGLRMGGEDSWQELLFRPGFSTREGTDLSAGRGIGLSAVAAAVRRYGGRVEMSSEKGVGSRFLLRLPLSVSITRALLLRVDGEEYALPLGAVVEGIRLAAEDLQAMGNGRVLRWRNGVIPVLDLGQRFATSNGEAARTFVVVVESLGRFRALAVDALVGIQDIVVKGLDSLLGAPLELAGSTILGDGRVILILDPPSLVGEAAG